ncbi:hypothetical protein WH47_05051 [Habropoda laboriosa]|uniref:DUF4817 domain-containing protein n=1 Tax=Habropoda laboriosa TaxID=597456 RepID=A0A0L7RKS9_9HYME|nr:hypothetical protein WH47_05051 [Habropoda laboriosa]
MPLIFGECRNNVREAVRLYATRYPERHQPCTKMFYNIEKKLRKHGEFETRKRNKPRSTTTESNATTVLMRLEENPRTSIRAITAQTALSRSSVCRMIKTNHYHPYKMMKVQHLQHNRKSQYTHVWGGLMHGHLIGPYFYEQNLTSEVVRVWSSECRDSGGESRSQYLDSPTR